LWCTSYETLGNIWFVWTFIFNTSKITGLPVLGNTQKVSTNSLKLSFEKRRWEGVYLLYKDDERRLLVYQKWNIKPHDLMKIGPL